jgi:hypothetical protein
MFNSMAALALSTVIIIIIFSLLLPGSSSHYTINTTAFSNVKTDGHTLSIKNAYGFTYKPSSDDDNNGKNSNLTIQKYQQIKNIQSSGLSFTDYIHQVSIGAADPNNFTAIKDYKAIQKHMQKIDEQISECDVMKDFITSSIDATNLCMRYSSFVYETCAGDHNIYGSICNNSVIEHILKTTKPSSEELNRRAYDEAAIAVPLEYR